jgi:hypothetical protein
MTAQLALSSARMVKNGLKMTCTWYLGLNGKAWAFEK